MDLTKIKHNTDLKTIEESQLFIRTKKTTRKIVTGVLKAIFLIGFCFVILYPILTMISKAFMERNDIFDNTVILIPKHFTMQNFQIAVILLDYWKSLGNTLTLSLLVTVLETASCLLVGYGFARYRFKLKGLFMALVIFTIIVPPSLILYPMYVQFKLFDPLGIVSLLHGEEISLIGTYWPFSLLAVTAMGTKNGLFILIFTQFFRNMPKEFEEAAFIDGAGSFKTFLKIMLPNSQTAIVTVALFGFLWQYNDLSYTTVFLQGKSVFSNTFYNLTRFTGQIYEILGTNQYDMTLSMYYPLVMSTGVLLILLPLILMFLVAQKFFVESIERVGIVG